MMHGIETACGPIRQTLLQHPVYGAIRDVHGLRVFMEHHVFAVWDFMLLVKRLQRDLTGGSLWIPPADARLARTINDIVLAEESDLDRFGEPASHLDLYRAGMLEVGADVRPINAFVGALRRRDAPLEALDNAKPPVGAKRFVAFTLDLARNGTTAEVLGAFLYGREDLIPAMFRKLPAAFGVCAPGFRYYIDRHIELDEDVHAPAARKGLRRILQGDPTCADDVSRTVQACLRERRELWDAVHASLSVNAAR